MSRVKVLLMHVYNDHMSGHFEEIGICFITSFLRQHGYEVMLLCVHENRIDYDKIINYFPGIIGISVYEVSKLSVYGVIEKLKKVLPNVSICVGGPLPTYSGQEMLEEFPLIDFVVKGEGEVTFLELVSQIPNIDIKKLDNIKGLAFRKGKTIQVNEKRPLIEDINSLPMPARDILRDNGLTSAQISTSRGCTSRCTFCVSSLFWKKWRGRAVEKVLEEMEYIIKEYGIKKFNFIDASFEDPGPQVDRIQDLARAIKNNEWNISYFTDVRADFHRKATPEIMKLIKESGLCGSFVGIESANEYDLKLYGKISSVEDSARVTEIFRNYGINIEPGFINFNPYSTFEGLQKNIGFLEKYGWASNIRFITNRLLLFKGTRIYFKIKNDGLLKDPQSTEPKYFFIDEKIARLYSYIKDYLKKIEIEIPHRLYIIYYYTVKYLTLLVHLKRQFEIACEHDAYKAVLEAEQQNKAVVADNNYKVARWYRELLTQAENGWDKGKADEISNFFLAPDYIRKTADTLDKYKNKLYKKLIKFGLDSYLSMI